MNKTKINIFYTWSRPRFLLRAPAFLIPLYQEEKTGQTFREGRTVKQLVELAKVPQLFDAYDIDFPCFCNAD